MSDTGWQLVERERSCLVVVDVQDYFLAKLPVEWREPLVARIAWLMRVAAVLEVPVIATAEDVARDGPLVPALEALLPEASPPPFDKVVFGLAGQDDVRDAVEGTVRDTFVLVGLETDVCVAQSALGLRARGHRAVVVEDACASPPPHHEAGIRRLRDAGVTVTSAKGLYYEWARDLVTHHRVQAATGGAIPPGMSL